MTTLSGRYVQTFAEASHALPERMPMNADYPLMLPPIKAVAGGEVVLVDCQGNHVAAKILTRGEYEFCEVAQSSSFEKMLGRKPQRFRFNPFLDERSVAIGDSSRPLFS